MTSFIVQIVFRSNPCKRLSPTRRSVACEQVLFLLKIHSILSRLVPPVLLPLTCHHYYRGSKTEKLPSLSMCMAIHIPNAGNIIHTILVIPTNSTNCRTSIFFCRSLCKKERKYTSVPYSICQ